MGSHRVEKVNIPTRTEITRLDVDSCCTDDEICVSSVNVADGHSAEEVSGKTHRGSQMQEILREQLCRAQETLAANHEHALVLLARGLATSQFRVHADTDEDSECREVRTVPATSVDGNAMSVSSSGGVPLRSREHFGNSCASAGGGACTANKRSNLPGMPHSPPDEPGSGAALKSEERHVMCSPVKEGTVEPPAMRFTRLGELRLPAGVAPHLETLPAKKKPMPARDSTGASPSSSPRESNLSSATAPKTSPSQLLTSTVPWSGRGFGQSMLSVHSVSSYHMAPPKATPPLTNVAGQRLGEGSLTTPLNTAMLEDRETIMTALRRSMEDGQNYKFEVLQTWKKDKKQEAAKQGRLKQMRQKGGHRTRNLENRADASWQVEIAGHEKGDTCCVVHPHSTKRFAWDLSSLILVTYDMAVIPLSFFDPPASFFLTFCAWITRCFWTFDIVASFITGYLKADGSTEMRFVKIARRYILSWLLLDLMIVGVDWFEVLMSSMGSMGAARLVRSSRTIRIIRLVRLLRLVRMQTVLQQFAENIQSEVALVVLDIIKMIVLIMAMAHLLACIWYGIGALDVSDTWVRTFDFERQNLGYRYATSLHWSLSQFTGGMDEVRPCNVGERLYVILVFLLCFIVAAVFVSHITSSMTRLHMITSHQSLQLSVLRKYFQQNKISKRLAARVLRNAKNAVAEKQRFMPESSVELLNLVSEPLHVELHFEMFSPILDVHNFFKTYIEECPQVMRKVCHSATAMSAVSPGDLVFNNGEMPSAPKMYFIVSGGLQYTTASGSVHDVASGDWLSEGTLWTPWMHRGDLEALRESRLCTIDAKNFQELVCQFEHAGFDPKDHAAHFVHCLNNIDAEITDLDCTGLKRHTASVESDPPDSPWSARNMFVSVVASRASNVLGLNKPPNQDQ